jgi:hypothetical protein
MHFIEIVSTSIVLCFVAATIVGLVSAVPEPTPNPSSLVPRDADQVSRKSVGQEVSRTLSCLGLIPRGATWRSALAYAFNRSVPTIKSEAPGGTTVSRGFITGVPLSDSRKLQHRSRKDCHPRATA